MAERSIIVKGSSLEDAVQRALSLLQVERSEVTYEILQQGGPGRAGLVGTPFKLRVTVGGAPLAAATDESTGEINLMDLLFESAEPEPADDDLETMSSSAFLDLLDRIDRGIAVQEPSSDDMAGDGGLNGQVQVEIAPNRMEAFVTVTPAQSGGHEATAADVHAALGAAGVRYGIDDAAIADALFRRKTRVIVARGLPPLSGEDASVRFLTAEGTLTDTPPQRREVAPDTVVALKVPQREGSPGYSVLGQVLPPHLGRDISLQSLKGKNVRVSADGRELIATAAGVVASSGGRIYVESSLVIDGDVTAESGKIHFIGDIVIQGSVRRGVSVFAGGNLIVRGGVDISVLQAEGDIVVDGGIVGRGVGIVRAKGALECRFLEDVRVIVGGDARIEDYVRGGDLQSDGKVTVGGNVAGAHVYGVGGIRVRSAGNAQKATTTLAAGGAYRTRQEIEKIRERTARIGHLLESVEARLAGLLEPEHAGNPLSLDERREAVRLVEERAKLRAESEHLTNRRSELLGALDAVRGVVVAVTERAHAGTRILIDEAALELPTDTQFASFTRDTTSSLIRMTSLR